MRRSTPKSKTPDNLVSVYQCFADETRLRILNVLLRGPLSVQQVMRALRLKREVASRHLGYLKKRGVLEVERASENRLEYSLPIERPKELQVQLDFLDGFARTLERLREDVFWMRRVLGSEDQLGLDLAEYDGGAVGERSPTPPWFVDFAEVDG